MIVVHPAVADRATLDRLRRAGYVAVVGEAEHFRTLNVLPVATLDIITEAALEAIDNGREHERFGRSLLRRLRAREAPDA